LKDKNPRFIGHKKELIATRKNGETFPALISFSVNEVDGKSFFTGIVRDMTETKVLEERINKSERLAALGQIVAEINHEIKNPLTLIGGFANHLIKTTKNKKSISELKIITEEIQRLESFVGNLNEYYLPRNVIIEFIDINALLDEVYTLAKNQSIKRNIQLEMNTSNFPLLVEGDREKLKQVFLNLIKNGIEALNDGGTLSINSSLVKDIVEIIISDNGPGIPKDDQGKIFTPFFTSKRDGTGLGLSVSKRIIEDHKDSSFTLTSQEGKGTAFKIALPYAGEKRNREK